MGSPERSRLGMLLRGAISFALGLGCLYAAAMLLLPNLLSTSTSLAVVNARLIPLRTPLSGQVVSAGVEEGEAIRTQIAVFCIEDPQPERRYLATLDSECAALRARVAGLEAQQKQLESLCDEFKSRTRDYQSAFADFLDLRIYQSRSQASATASRLKLSDLEQKMTESLAVQQAAATKEKKQADILYEVAQAEHAAALSSVEQHKQERAALGKNIFLGSNDGRPGTPYFAQRLDELTLLRLDVQARLEENRARVRETERQRAVEWKEIDNASRRVVRSPREGVLFRRHVQPGQYVKENSELGQVIDPQEIFVEAIVGAADFRKIEIGDPARVRLEGATRNIKGKVTRKVGALIRRDAEALAAELVSGNKEGDYRVWIAFDRMPAAANRDNGYLLGCKVHVRFGDHWLTRGWERDE
jgi:multidrug resistance efflux pump